MELYLRGVEIGLGLFGLIFWGAEPRLAGARDWPRAPENHLLR